jgi:hypothetical protein
VATGCSEISWACVLGKESSFPSCLAKENYRRKIIANPIVTTADFCNDASSCHLDLLDRRRYRLQPGGVPSRSREEKKPQLNRASSTWNLEIGLWMLDIQV